MEIVFDSRRVAKRPECIPSGTTACGGSAVGDPPAPPGRASPSSEASHMHLYADRRLPTSSGPHQALGPIPKWGIVPRESVVRVGWAAAVQTRGTQAGLMQEHCWRQFAAGLGRRRPLPLYPHPTPTAAAACPPSRHQQSQHDTGSGISIELLVAAATLLLLVLPLQRALGSTPSVQPRIAGAAPIGQRRCEP